MISDKKYVNASKMEQPIIKSVGFNNEDVLITENGEYKTKSPYTGFGKVIVNVPPVEVVAKYTNKYIVDENGVVSRPNKIMDFNGIKEVNEDYIFYYMYYQNKNIDGEADLSSVNIISGAMGCAYMFFRCTELTSADLSSLTTVSGKSGCACMFYGCTGLISVDLSALTTISGDGGCIDMFDECTSLTNVNLSSLTTISGQSACNAMFRDCTELTSVDLSGLTTIRGRFGCARMFYGCKGLKRLDFPALKTVIDSQVFNSMLANVTGCTVHFPSNLESYAFNCDGIDTTVLYDLPATE